MEDLRLPCTVGGMNRPIFLALFCQVKGLSVSYRTCNDDQTDRYEIQYKSYYWTLRLKQRLRCPVAVVPLHYNGPGRGGSVSDIGLKKSVISLETAEISPQNRKYRFL